MADDGTTMQQSYIEKLEALWRAAGATGPLPELGEDAVLALGALVDAMARDGLDDRGWRRWRVEEEGDPYPAIALTDSAYASLLAAVQVTQMLPLQCDRLQDMSIYIDPVPDAEGELHACLRDEEVLPGLPHASFASLDDLLRWMILISEGRAADAASLLDDSVGAAASPLSGAGVLEAMVDLQVAAGESLGGVWWAAAAGRAGELVVEPEVSAAIHPVDRSPGWGRRLCLRALHRLLLGENVPPEAELGEGEMSPPQRAFLAHLRQLQAALDGEIPQLMIDVAQCQNEALAERAEEWLDTFEAATEEVAEPTDFEAVLAQALGQVLGDLVEEGLLEMESAAMPALVTELVEVAVEAPNPKKMVHRLVAALVDSDLVEEVYADDQTLFDRYTRGFGR